MKVQRCTFPDDPEAAALDLVEFDTPQRDVDRASIGNETDDPNRCADLEKLRATTICYRVRAPSTVFVFFRVDPWGAQAGKYVSTIDVQDDLINALSIPVTITLQYEHWWLLVLALFPVLLVGTFLVWAASAKPMFGQGLRSLSKILFALSAAGGAYYATYWRNPSWGSDGWEIVTLGGVVLTAYMSSLTAGMAADGRGAQVDRVPPSPEPPASERTPRRPASSNAFPTVLALVFLSLTERVLTRHRNRG